VSLTTVKVFMRPEYYIFLIAPAKCGTNRF
jgi:hypothetical protein